MRIGILHIGDELLTGAIDPYPREIIALIRHKGADLDLLEVLGDREDDIVRGLHHAEALGIDVLVITGGLGPTLDDLTREAVARYLGVELVVDPRAEVALEEALTRMHGRRAEMNDIIRRMARVPRGAKALRNGTGAACGIEAVHGTLTLFCLPGFPNEMVPMFREHVLPRIAESGAVELEVRVWRGESSLEPLFQEVAAAHEVRIASLPSVCWREEGNRVIFKGPRDEAEAALAHFQRLLERGYREF
jgi:molybdenum cofactor synthesis domain-containing protein